MGVFILLVADAFGAIYRFKEKVEIHYFLSIVFDFTVQYLIFRAFLFDVEEDHYIYDNFKQ